MRSVVFRYDDLLLLADALDQAHGQGLPLPAAVQVQDGEWVLAMFELTGSRRATAAAGRGVIHEGGPALVFERRDWERLKLFSRARSESETRVHAAAAAEEAQLDDADTARSGIHAADPLRESGGPIPAESRLRQTLGWERRENEPVSLSSSSGEAIPVEVSLPPPVPAEGGATEEVVEDPTMRGRASGAASAVLLVDDDEDLREVVGAMLEAVGLVVAAVGSAEEALVLLDERPFALVLLDWSLPGMNGLELCRALRRHPKHSQLAMIFLTAHSATQDMVEAFAAGADDYVVKPFRAAELGARIFGLLRRARPR